MLADGDQAAGFLFKHPFTAGHPRAHNKILWVTKAPRGNNPLLLSARNGAVTRRFRVEADSGPGEIYPSSFEVPTAGCWRLTLEWGSHHATADVQVLPRTTT